MSGRPDVSVHLVMYSRTRVRVTRRACTHITRQHINQKYSHAQSQPIPFVHPARLRHNTDSSLFYLAAMDKKRICGSADVAMGNAVAKLQYGSLLV